MQYMQEIEERIYARIENDPRISMVLLDGWFEGLEMMMQMMLREIDSKVWVIFMIAQYFGIM
jgi:hypothetical protein